MTIWEITCTLYNNRMVTPPKRVTSPTLYRSGVPYQQNCHATQMLINELFCPHKRSCLLLHTCMLLLFFTRKLLPLRMLLTDCLKSSQKKVIVMEVQFTSSLLTDTSLSQAPLLPEFVPAFLYSLYLTLYKMDISLRQTPRCKEKHFYSLPFGQAEASIY